MNDTLTDEQATIRWAHIHSLHRIVDWLATHPDVKPHTIGIDEAGVTARVYGIGSRDKLVAMARAIGGRWDKREGDTLFTLRQQVGENAHVELTVWREQVCERVITGQVTFEEPDPALVAALPTVTRTVDTVEWRCPPHLLGDQAA